MKRLSCSTTNEANGLKDFLEQTQKEQEELNESMKESFKQRDERRVREMIDWVPNFVEDSGLARNFIDAAKNFAIEAHGVQVRKYTGLPYVSHTEEVADIVRSHNGSKEMIAAALLHDTVEDTSATDNDIREAFGDPTADMVWWLTDTSKPEDGNRAIRKGIDRDRLSRAPAAVQLIKAADMISNGRDIKVNDPKFGTIYIAEMKQLLSAMTKIHSMDIFKEAQGVVDGS